MENTKTEEASQMQLDWMYLINGVKSHPNWSCPSCNWFKIHSHSHAYSQQLLSRMRIKRTMTTRGPQTLSSNCVCFHLFATALTCYADMLGKKKCTAFTVVQVQTTPATLAPTILVMWARKVPEAFVSLSALVYMFKRPWWRNFMLVCGGQGLGDM